jgi:hypothetical protein
MLTLATITYQKTSLSWQFQKLSQRVKEWVILHLGQWNPDLPNIPDGSFASLGLRILFWLLVAAFVVWCSWLLYRLVIKIWPVEGDIQIGRSQTHSARNLPQSVTDWLKVAQSAQQQGNYPEAGRALYMAMIAQLNETRLIPDDRSRTDGEYQQLVAQLPQAEAYQILIKTHEELQFGNGRLSLEGFQRCQRAYSAIEQGLNP